MMNKLYIGNLSPAVTADDLRQLFGDRKLPLAGQVLLKSGYAFVDYPDQNWAIRAIETLSGEQSPPPPPPASPSSGRDGARREAEPAGGARRGLPRPHAHFPAPDPQLSAPARSPPPAAPDPPAPRAPGRSPGATPVRLRGCPGLARALGAPPPAGCPRRSPSFPTPIPGEPPGPLPPDLPAPLCQGPPRPARPACPGPLAPRRPRRRAPLAGPLPTSPRAPPLSEPPRRRPDGPLRGPGAPPGPQPRPLHDGAPLSVPLPNLRPLSLVSQALLFFSEFFVRFY